MLGLILAAVAIVVAIVVARRYGTRRTVLVVDTRNVRKPALLLTKPDGETELIEPNPTVQYIVQIRLTNRGPADIPATAFNKVPLIFGLGAATSGILATNAMVRLELKERQALLRPRQIALGTSWQWEIHTYGEYPYLTIGSDITNVDIKVRQYRDSTGPGAMLGGFGFSGSQEWWKQRFIRH